MRQKLLYAWLALVLLASVCFTVYLLFNGVSAFLAVVTGVGVLVVGLANWLGHARGLRRIESGATFIAICIAAVFSYAEHLGTVFVGLLVFACIFSAIDLVSKWNDKRVPGASPLTKP